MRAEVQPIYRDPAGGPFSSEVSVLLWHEGDVIDCLVFSPWDAQGPVALDDVEQEINEEVDGFLRDLNRDHPIESDSEHPPMHPADLVRPYLRRDESEEFWHAFRDVDALVRSSPKDAWLFLTAAVDQAQSLDELGHLAAGPFEEFIAYWNAAYEEQVESRGREDPRWAYVISMARGPQVDYLLSRLKDAWPGPIADAAQQKIDITEPP